MEKQHDDLTAGNHRRGNLFAEIGEDRHVDGLRQIRSFEPVDPDQHELDSKAYQLVWNTASS